MGRLTPIIAANWKMNKTRAEARRFAEGIGEVPRGIELVICPPFTAIDAFGKALESRGLKGILLGAQNVYWEESGAFTGEISPSMLVEAGCAYAVIGHSERRTLFGETDEDVRQKVGAVLRAGLNPILCVGETIEQRDASRAGEVVRRQVVRGLEGIPPESLAPGRDGVSRLVVAYEPVWAIGTGRAASPGDAEEMAEEIRDALTSIVGSGTAQAVRVAYGGSVKPGNARDLAELKEVDGALVGGASLDAGQLIEIAKAWAPS